MAQLTAAPPTTMRALVLEDYGHLSVAELPTPEAGPGEVLLRIHATGICGSDLHGYTGENGRRRPGQVMGHETVGTVVGLGPGARGGGAGLGDLVTVNPGLACGQCPACHAGRGHICRSRRVIGVDPDLTSAFADYLAVPASNVVPFTSGAFGSSGASSVTHGALVEPLAVGYHAAVRGEVREGADVLVLGGGPIGQAAVLACRRLGAGRIRVSEPLESRRLLVAGLGAQVLDPAAGDVAEQVQAGGPAEVTLDAVGSSATIATALNATQPGGRCVLVGMAAPDVRLDAFAVSTQERTLVGAFCYSPAEFAATAWWAGEVPDLLASLISLRVTPEEAPAAFSDLARGHDVVGKVLVVFDPVHA